MVAARKFVERLRKNTLHPARIKCDLYGSLAFTGKGHGSDTAIMLGLCGERPEEILPSEIPRLINEISRHKILRLSGGGKIGFDPARDIVFLYGQSLPAHANGMKFTAFDVSNKPVLDAVYYSTGGGFVVSQREMSENDRHESGPTFQADVPYPFKNATQMLQMGRESGLSIARMKEANEKARGVESLDRRLDEIWQVMNSCIDTGLVDEGVLPGVLKVERRAATLHKQLRAETGNNRPAPHLVMDWLSIYAIAVNEENAAGGRIVTAPTNGAAGVIPSVLRYYKDHCHDSSSQGRRDFLLTAAAIGGVIRHNASISGAEVGCQGEVGSASAMAAAGFAAATGGSNEQIENAAEIALEHHLGMTCDPIGGLVQVPCIERNALGAVKAVTAASLALRGNGSHFVPLDSCIETMRQTGLDMKARYKETSRGGLAVNVVEC